MDEPTIDHKQPPTTVREVGIHLIYMSKNMAEINAKLTSMSNSFATKQELLTAVTERRRETDEIIKDIDCVGGRVTKIESFISGLTKKIAGVAITILVMMILALYGLDKFFRV